MRCRLRGRREPSFCNIFSPWFSYSPSIITNAGSTTHRIIMSHPVTSPPPFPATSGDVAAVTSPNELESDVDGVDGLYACEIHDQICSHVAPHPTSRRKRDVRRASESPTRTHRERLWRRETSPPASALVVDDNGSLPLVQKWKSSVFRLANNAKHLPSYFIVLVTLLSHADMAAAAPTSLHKRDNSTVKIIVPVVVVGVLLIIAVMTTCMRSGMRTSMARWTTNAANSFGPNTGATSTNDTRERSARQLLSNNNSSNSGPRELTAQQLAGSAADSLTEPAPAPRSRRSRRPNRRASQISTHSLPVYMKEPGEQEVIIYRGPEDMMEEPPTTAHVVMPSLAEGNESPDLSLETAHGQANVYAEMPDSPHDMPLLSSDESRADVDNSRAHLITPRRGGSARPSMETLATAEGANSPTVDPRGEAPAYFEVVQLDDLSAANTPEIPSPPSPEVPAQEPPENPRRRSGLFSLFHVRHHASRPQHLPAEASSSATHRRDASNVSNISTPSTIARPRSRAQSRAGTHRPSVSGSGFSILSRSRSRLLESPHLTSPSTISLHSISAPLTHTTTRSEFTYPRTGPTPEQIKLISSRESIARFGVPYGQDAIAFAASSSRMELPLHPPPDFEAFARPSGSPLVPSASPRISHDSAVDDVLDQDDTVHEADETAEEEAESASPTNDAADTSALPTLSEPVVAEGSPSSDASSARDSTTTVSAPPGLGGAAPAAPTPPTALRARSPLQVHPRPESRASSFTSFATAEESLPSAAAAATPYGSASSRLTLPKVLIPDTSAGTATPTSATASEPSTPRPATARLHAPEPTDATATPTSAATEVARAL